jgi:hypothetical protein
VQRPSCTDLSQAYIHRLETKNDFGDVLVAAVCAVSAVVAAGVLLLVDAALVAVCSAAIETFAAVKRKLMLLLLQ